MVEASSRCYACTIRVGAWGQPAQEALGDDGVFHWWVRAGTQRLCEVR